jgi:tyrosine decarboxylase
MTTVTMRRTKEMNNPDVNALFLGPKGENKAFFREMLAEAVDQHVAWRQTFRPSDPYLTTTTGRHEPSYRNTLYSTEEVLTTLSSKLQQDSLPWFSPRYIGHMNSDTLMVANLAYVMAMLYNPNNCAKEASPVTTQLEIEAGHDLCKMFGYAAERSWGHITSGGTVANYEALWLARNLKATPDALAELEGARDLVACYTESARRNLPVQVVLDMIEETERRGLLHALQNATPRGKGLKQQSLGKVLIPRSKHYSWLKAVDILGLGSDSIVPIDVDENFRTDVRHLKAKLEELIHEGTPILAVVTVVGTTEEGAVDPVHEICAYRRECEEKNGVSFYLHCDAAYGGYVRSMFLDEQDQFLSSDELKKRYHTSGLIPSGVTWPKPSVYEAFKAMAQCDSITVDPHKSGYIPYAAGAITIRDKRILKLISYEAAYVESGASDDVVLGHNIMEGSKAGATAAAVWATHRTVPLNLDGYGPVIGNGIVTADWLAHQLEQTTLNVKGKIFQIHLLMFPDYHMINFGFKEQHNSSLEDYNALNRRFYERSSFMSGRTYQKNFLTSATSLTREEYGETPSAYARRIGIAAGEWERIESVYILRAAVMTQFLRRKEVFDDYWNDISNEFKLILESIYQAS